MDCPEEQRTLHHSGKGFGVVQDDEFILLGVFADMKRNGNSLQENSFDAKALASKSLSVARQRYTTKKTFETKVVNGAIAKKGALVGIARVEVLAVRKLRTTVQRNGGQEAVRSFLALDDVEPDDYSGHATLGHAEIKGVNPNTLGKLRKKMRLDLANIFSDIIDIDRVGFATAFDLTCSHLARFLNFRARPTS